MAQPPSARRTAVARPMPREAPVTSADLPSNSFGMRHLDGCPHTAILARRGGGLVPSAAHAHGGHRTGRHRRGHRRAAPPPPRGRGGGPPPPPPPPPRPGP